MASAMKVAFAAAKFKRNVTIKQSRSTSNEGKTPFDITHQFKNNSKASLGDIKLVWELITIFALSPSIFSSQNRVLVSFSDEASDIVKVALLTLFVSERSLVVDSAKPSLQILGAAVLEPDRFTPPVESVLGSWGKVAAGAA